MSALDLAKRALRWAWKLAHQPAELRRQLDEAKLLTARLLIANQHSHGPYANLRDAEFKVFSQFGDDGIIQYLVHAAGVIEQRFIEFGVEDYSEASTRLLLVNDNWRGLVIDSGAAAIESIRRQDLFWRHDLVAVHALVTRDNVNELFRTHGFAGPLGLLSIDIDGNDYWVWEAINVVDPVIVVVEYNSVFGPSRAVTIPYDPGFTRARAHRSRLYWGASLKALCLLAERKGYVFVGSNSAGNNAYFVRRSRLGPLRCLTSEEGYVESRFRESRDAHGRLTYVDGDRRRQLIADLLVEDIERGAQVRVGDL